MVYNSFQETLSEYEYLCKDYPGLITLSIGGQRLLKYLDTWDTPTLGLIERIAKVEWRMLDTVFGLFRETVGIDGQLSLQQLRQAWRLLWLATVKHYENPHPKRSLTLVESGAQLLDQMEVDFLSLPPHFNADMWINHGRIIILSLRETELP